MPLPSPVSGGFRATVRAVTRSTASAKVGAAPPTRHSNSKPPLLRAICSMTSALAAVDVQDFAGHEVCRLEIEDRVDDIGDLAHMADRMQGVELRMRPGRVHRRLDDTQRDRVHADAALRIFNRE